MDTIDKNISISPELIEKYITGRATLDEWIDVVTAMRCDPSIRMLVEESRKVYNDLYGKAPVRNPCLVVRMGPPSDGCGGSQPWHYESEGNRVLNVSLPVFSLAAISVFNDCVVKCEHHVLRQRGKASEYQKLYREAVARNWLRTESNDGKVLGTPLYNIGRLSELASLSVARVFKGTLDGLKKELLAGCSVIAAVSARRLHGKRSAGCDHAVVVLGVSEEEDYVEVYDPESGNATDRYAVKSFLGAWKPSRNFFVSVVERGVRPYTPHPVDVSRVRLPEDVASLKHMLAENAHEIWAACRIISRKLRAFFQDSPEESFGKEQVLCALDCVAGIWRRLAEETLADMVDNGELRKAGRDSYRLKRRGKTTKARFEEGVCNDPYMRPFRDLADDDKKTDYTSSVNTLKLLYKMGYRIVRGKGVDVRFVPNRLTSDGRYVPNPMDVDDVELPDEIVELTEYIAENAHEEWARQRLKEGWAFGEKTNKKLKLNYDLVPYCELLDSEKKYDRRMAMNTVGMLYKMGYRFVKEKRK